MVEVIFLPKKARFTGTKPFAGNSRKIFANFLRANPENPHVCFFGSAVLQIFLCSSRVPVHHRPITMPNPNPQMAWERRDEARCSVPMVIELSISMPKLAILLLISRVLLPVRDFRIELRDWKGVEASHTPFNVLLLVNCQAGQRV